jgi:hypothetical protein
MIDERVRRLLVLVWWVLCPAFLLLVARFSYERACLDPYELLRPLMRRQAVALTVSAIYVGAHVWLAAAGVLTARMWMAGASTLVGVLQTGWRGDRYKVIAMSVAIAIEQVPRAVWAWLYHTLGVC